MERMGCGDHGEFSEGRLSALESHGGVVMVCGGDLVMVRHLEGEAIFGMKEDEWNSLHLLNSIRC